MAGFENTAGLGVRNWYGPRRTGGTRGFIKTEGMFNQFEVDLTITGIPFIHPIPKGGMWVTQVDGSFVTGTVTAVTIGGVNVTAATATVPVFVPQANTGVIAVTGGTAGPLIIHSKNVAGA